MKPSRTALVSATLATGLAQGASAQSYIWSMECNVPGNPTAAVPGLPGVEFFPGTAVDVFRLPVASNSQSFWVMTARIGSAGVRAVLLGGQNIASRVIAIEGQPTPFLPARNWGDFDAQLSVNESGSVALVSNLSGNAADDEVVARFKLSTHAFDLPYREGQQADGLAPGVLYSTFLGSPSVTDDEEVSALANLVGPGVNSVNDAVAEFDHTVLLRKGVTQPAGSLTPWASFVDGTFQVPAHGLFVVQGTDGATAPTNQIAAVNNAVVLRVGTVIPGLSSPIGANHIDRICLASCGDWIARGQNQSPVEDWVVLNGNVFNRRGGDITPVAPSGERFSDQRFAPTFFEVTVNAAGDILVGGFTDNPDANRDEVLVLNNKQIVAREGDPIDLDANGVYDDNAFIGGFVPDSGFVVSMSGSAVVYQLVPVRNSMGQIIGYSRICINPVQSCAADFNQDGSVDFFDYDAFVQCFEGTFCPPWTSADFDGDGTVDFFDYDAFVVAFETPCP